MVALPKQPHKCWNSTTQATQQTHPAPNIVVRSDTKTIMQSSENWGCTTASWGGWQQWDEAAHSFALISRS